MDNQPPTPPATTQPTPSPASPPATSSTTPSWSKYIGQIVRWEDGTCWLVKDDGRHWVPDGGTYESLVKKGSQVFNLPSQELDQIPDIKGSSATA